MRFIREIPAAVDGRGRPCYVPEPGVHVYGVGHRHPISGVPRVCVRRLDGGLTTADPELYLPLEAR